MDKEVKVLMAASECSGFAKVGGLGDVVYDLSVELARLGTTAYVIMPLYSSMGITPEKVAECSVEFGTAHFTAHLHALDKNGVTFYFVGNETFFDGTYGDVYIDSTTGNKGPFEDDALRFAFFSKAVAEFLNTYKGFQEITIVHCHDWHTGFLLTLLNQDVEYHDLKKRIKTVFTIHNLNYQGIRPFTAAHDATVYASFKSWYPSVYQAIAGEEIIQSLSYPQTQEVMGSAEYKRVLAFCKKSPEEKKLMKHCYRKKKGEYRMRPDLSREEKQNIQSLLLASSILCFNPMRAAIHFADAINTVSKTYAAEITQPNDPIRHLIRGCGLENDLKKAFAAGKLGGIINGIDYTQYDPHTLPIPFNVSDVQWKTHKESNKQQLLKKLPELLDQVYAKIGTKFKNHKEVFAHLKTLELSQWLNKPLIVSVGRATDQKMGILFEQYHKKETLLEEILKRDAFFLIVGSGEFENKLELLNRYPNALYITAFEANFGTTVYASGDLFFMPSYYEPCGISQLIAMRYGTLPIVHDIGGLHDTVEDGKTGFKYAGTEQDSPQQALLATLDRAIATYQQGERFAEMQKAALEVQYGWEYSAKKYRTMYQKLL